MNSDIHAFTSVTSNYIPKARVLAESVKRVDPSVCFHLLLSDEPPAEFELANEPFDNLIRVTDLPIDNLPAWIFSHRLVELFIIDEHLNFSIFNFCKDRVFIMSS